MVDASYLREEEFGEKKTLIERGRVNAFPLLLHCCFMCVCVCVCECERNRARTGAIRLREVSLKKHTFGRSRIQTFNEMSVIMHLVMRGLASCDHA